VFLRQRQLCNRFLLIAGASEVQTVLGALNPGLGCRSSRKAACSGQHAGKNTECADTGARFENA